MSLTLDDDVLIRRLVLGMSLTLDEMQTASMRSCRFWFPPGPSWLSQMSPTDDDDDDDDDLCEDDREGESSSSTSPQ